MATVAVAYSGPSKLATESTSNQDSTALPSGSTDAVVPLTEKLRAEPSLPEVGPVALATGAMLPTETAQVAVPVAPWGRPRWR